MPEARMSDTWLGHIKHLNQVGEILSSFGFRNTVHCRSLPLIDAGEHEVLR